MSAHVSQIVRGCFHQLRRIKTNHGFIHTSIVVLANSFIAWVDYGNSLLTTSWQTLPTCQLVRIQSVFSMAGHYPIVAMIYYKIIYTSCVILCLIAYKAPNGLIPNHTSDYFIRVAGIQNRSRLQSSSKKIQLPRSSTKFSDFPFISLYPLSGTVFPTT